MINPSVDLAAEPIGWYYPKWIVPLHELFRDNAWSVQQSLWKEELQLDLPPQMQIANFPRNAAQTTARMVP